jgi:hypothetical protein
VEQDVKVKHEPYGQALERKSQQRLPMNFPKEGKKKEGYHVEAGEEKEPEKQRRRQLDCFFPEDSQEGKEDRDNEHQHGPRFFENSSKGSQVTVFHFTNMQQVAAGNDQKHSCKPPPVREFFENQKAGSQQKDRCEREKGDGKGKGRKLDGFHIEIECEGVQWDDYTDNPPKTVTQFRNWDERHGKEQKRKAVKGGCHRHFKGGKTAKKLLGQCITSRDGYCCGKSKGAPEHEKYLITIVADTVNCTPSKSCLTAF